MKKEHKETQKEHKKQTPEEIQKTLQEKYMEYQMLEEQLKQVQEQVQTIKKQQEELEGIREALDYLSKTTTGTELLVPVSSGIFVKASITETKNVLMNVGDGVVVPKSMNDAVALISKQKEELSSYLDTLQQNLQLLVLYHERIETELQQIVQQQEKEE